MILLRNVCVLPSKQSSIQVKIDRYKSFSYFVKVKFLMLKQMIAV